jgi:hypothetical protein
MPASVGLFSQIVRIEDGVITHSGAITDAAIAAVLSEATVSGAMPLSILGNIALNAFRVAVNGSLTRFNLLDGVIDDFQDGNSVLSGGVVSGGLLLLGETQTLTASSVGGAEVAAQADDDNQATYWSADTGFPAWLMSDLGSPKVITRIRIASYTTNNTYCPTAFTIEASDTGVFGGEETVLSTLSGLSWNTAEIKRFDFENSTPYRYYRINVSSVVSAAYVIIAELDLFQDNIVSVKTVAESQPNNIHAVILADDAAIVLNTDLKLYVSVDDGATWEQITLEDSGDYSTTAKILTGSAAVTGTGSDIKYKIECTDIDYEFYAVGLLWD